MTGLPSANEHGQRLIERGYHPPEPKIPFDPWLLELIAESGARPPRATVAWCGICGEQVNGIEEWRSELWSFAPTVLVALPCGHSSIDLAGSVDAVVKMKYALPGPRELVP